MKKIFTMGGKFDTRNYTVKDIIDQKGEKEIMPTISEQR